MLKLSAASRGESSTSKEGERFICDCSLAPQQAAGNALACMFKIGAQVRVTVRKIWVKWASGCPYADVFAQAWGRLKKIPEKEVSPSPC